MRRCDRPFDFVRVQLHPVEWRPSALSSCEIAVILICREKEIERGAATPNARLVARFSFMIARVLLRAYGSASVLAPAALPCLLGLPQKSESVTTLTSGVVTRFANDLFVGPCTHVVPSCVRSNVTGTLVRYRVSSSTWGEPFRSRSSLVIRSG